MSAADAITLARAAGGGVVRRDDQVAVGNAGTGTATSATVPVAGGGGGGAIRTTFDLRRVRVLLVSRPEVDATDLYVIRHTADGGREAFVLAAGEGAPRTGWHPVATGCEAHLLARLQGSAGVDLWHLDALLERVKRELTDEAP